MSACPFPDCGRPLEGLGRFCHGCRRYPDDYRPEAPREPATKRRKDDRSEEEIQEGVKELLTTAGFAVWDTSQPFAAAITPGLPDLYAVGRGLCLWIECKSAKGVQSDAQKGFQKAVESNGGTYVLARHEEDVVGEISQTRMAS